MQKETISRAINAFQQVNLNEQQFYMLYDIKCIEKAQDLLEALLLRLPEHIRALAEPYRVALDQRLATAYEYTQYDIPIKEALGKMMHNAKARREALLQQISQDVRKANYAILTGGILLLAFGAAIAT